MYNFEDTFLFFGLSQEEKTQVVKMLPPPNNYKRSQCVYNAEIYEKALGVVLEGSVAAKSGKVIKRRFSAGDIFGAATIFTDATGYVSEIVALTDCVIQLIPEAVLKGIFAAHPETAVNYIKFLTEKVRFLNRKISQFSAPSACEKLYSFLRDSADTDGFVNVASMSSLAKQTGMGRTSLYRCLDELEQLKMVERNNTIIRVIK